MLKNTQLLKYLPCPPNTFLLMSMSWISSAVEEKNCVSPPYRLFCVAREVKGYQYSISNDKLFQRIITRSLNNQLWDIYTVSFLVYIQTFLTFTWLTVSAYPMLLRHNLDNLFYSPIKQFRFKFDAIDKAFLNKMARLSRHIFCAGKQMIMIRKEVWRIYRMQKDLSTQFLGNYLELK